MLPYIKNATANYFIIKPCTWDCYIWLYFCWGINLKLSGWSKVGMTSSFLLFCYSNMAWRLMNPHTAYQKKDNCPPSCYTKKTFIILFYFYFLTDLFNRKAVCGCSSSTLLPFLFVNVQLAEAKRPWLVTRAAHVCRALSARGWNPFKSGSEPPPAAVQVIIHYTDCAALCPAVDKKKRWWIQRGGLGGVVLKSDNALCFKLTPGLLFTRPVKGAGHT